MGTVPGTVREVVRKAFPDAICTGILTGTARANCTAICRGTCRAILAAIRGWTSRAICTGMAGVIRGWTWNATCGMTLTVILRAFCSATLGGKRGQSRGDTSTKRREAASRSRAKTGTVPRSSSSNSLRYSPHFRPDSARRVADVSPARGRAGSRFRGYVPRPGTPLQGGVRSEERGVRS